MNVLAPSSTTAPRVRALAGLRLRLILIEIEDCPCRDCLLDKEETIWLIEFLAQGDTDLLPLWS